MAILALVQQRVRETSSARLGNVRVTIIGDGMLLMGLPVRFGGTQMRSERVRQPPTTNSPSSYPSPHMLHWFQHPAMGVVN